MQHTLLGLLFMDLPRCLLVTVCPHTSFAIEQTLRSLECDSCDQKVFLAKLGGMPFIDISFLMTLGSDALFFQNLSCWVLLWVSV